MISSVKRRYKQIDFSKSVGIHLRFGDKRSTRWEVIYVTPPPAKYYNNALSKVRRKENILVFSDEIEVARKHLKDLRGNDHYMEGNKDYEDLYLMSMCHDFVCSTSTLSWWGAWLNNYGDGIIVTPKEWFRPGQVIRNDDLCCDGWIQLRTCRRIVDDYRIAVLSYMLKRSKKARGNSLKDIWLKLKSFFRTTQNEF
jgi:hypothetical protein